MVSLYSTGRIVYPLFLNLDPTKMCDLISPNLPIINADSESGYETIEQTQQALCSMAEDSLKVSTTMYTARLS